MRSGVIGELLDFSDLASAYAHFSQDPLNVDELLHKIRHDVYKRRLRSFSEKYLDLLSLDELADRLCRSTKDSVVVYDDHLNLAQVNAEAGLEFISAVSHLTIPFSEHPTFFMSREECDRAILDNPFVLHDIPAENFSAKAVANAVSRAGMALGWLDIDSRTYELCVDAVKSFPEAIALIPRFLMNREIVRHALLGNPYFALRHVPAELLDRDTLLEVVKSDPSFIQALLQLDPCPVDDEMVAEALVQMPSLLLLLPRRLLTKQVLMAFLKAHPELFLVLPLELLDEDLVAIVVRKRPDLITKIPVELRGVKVCAEYAKHNEAGLSQYFSARVIDHFKEYRRSIPINEEIGDIPHSIKIKINLNN